MDTFKLENEAWNLFQKFLWILEHDRTISNQRRLRIKILLHSSYIRYERRHFVNFESCGFSSFSVRLSGKVGQGAFL